MKDLIEVLEATETDLEGIILTSQAPAGPAQALGLVRLMLKNAREIQHQPKEIPVTDNDGATLGTIRVKPVVQGCGCFECANHRNLI